MNLLEASDLVAERETASATGLVFQSVTKRYKETVALSDASFSVRAGELVSVTGPSGAGKTTSARLISGLENQDAGRISIAGLDMGVLPPQKRRIAMMFESYALYPHLSVFDNVASPLRAPGHVRRINEAEIKDQVERLLALTEMTPLASRLPSQLSGGQKQRVALCRTLVQSPAAYLLDEPISHLDAKLRHRLRSEIRKYLKSTSAPAIWYTPDAVEAMAVGDRVVVLINGQVHQQGTPEEIFLKPADVEVARLLGDPPMNLITARLYAEAGVLIAKHPGGSVTLPENLRVALNQRSSKAEIKIGLRPAALRVVAPDTAGGLLGEVYTTEPFGKHIVISVRIGEDLVRARVDPPVPWKVGEAIAVTADLDRVLLFDAATGEAIGY